MDTWLIVLIVAAIALPVIAGFAVLFSSRRRSRRLREEFGPEYESTMIRTGSRRKAEAELEARRRRVEKLRLKEISPVRAQEYAERWRIVQGRFVDDPAGAIQQADQLCIAVMTERGYPMADFEQRAADLSVDHGETVRKYRNAHAISEASERGEATTEALREAMVDYRSLFEELLGPGRERQPERPPRETRVAH